MKPAPFDYHAPEDIQEALDLLREHAPDARVLAGGQSLIAQMNSRECQPGHVIDINRIPGLDRLSARKELLEVGATTRQAEVEHDPEVGERFSYLRDALRLTASAPVKHRGTLVGSLAHADPSAELPAVAVCMQAELTASSADRGAREVAAKDFFTGPFENALAPDEICLAARFSPLEPGQGFAIEETQRRYNGVAIAGAAAWIDGSDGRCTGSRLVLYGISATPLLVDTAALAAADLEDTSRLRSAAREITQTLDTFDDVLASAGYRRHAARVLAGRALERAARHAVGRRGE